MAPYVIRDAAVFRRQMRNYWLPHSAAESGRMSEDEVFSVASEVVPGDRRSVLAEGGVEKRFHVQKATGLQSCHRRRLGFWAIDHYEEAALAAHRRYYEAFEARDLDAMSDLWEHSDRVVCTHPGWVPLRGWAEVAGSYFALFNSADTIQFVLTEEQIEVYGPVAWVSVDENILGDQGGATVSALKVFVNEGGQWKLVAHQGGLVSPPTEGQDPD